MGLRPSQANENQARHPRASGGPRQEELDSRLRGNDVTFETAKRRIPAVGRKRRKQEPWQRSFASLRMTANVYKGGASVPIAAPAAAPVRSDTQSSR